MKINIKKEDLIRLLTPAQGLVEKRNIIPILSKILIKYENQKLKLYATDQENSLQSYFEVKGKEGAVCVDSRNFLILLRNFQTKKLNLRRHLKITI